MRYLLLLCVLVLGLGAASPAQEHDVMTLQGQLLPNTTLEMLGGPPLETTSLRGKPTVLNFWFTTCPPCIKEIPLLNELRADYSPNLVNMVAISFNPADVVEAFLAQRPYSFEHAVGAGAWIKRSLGMEAFPYTLVMDAEGRIVRIWRGQMKPRDDKKLRAVLEELLAE